jgi:hypothetical protein
MRMQEALQQLDHAPATRLFRAHALADQVQLRNLPGTEFRFPEYAAKEAQEEVAWAAQFPRAAVGEV